MWVGRGAVARPMGGPVALGSSRSSAGHTEAGTVGKIHSDMTITTEQL